MVISHYVLGIPAFIFTFLLSIVAIMVPWSFTWHFLGLDFGLMINTIIWSAVIGYPASYLTNLQIRLFARMLELVGLLPKGAHRAYPNGGSWEDYENGSAKLEQSRVTAHLEV